MAADAPLAMDAHFIIRLIKYRERIRPIAKEMKIPNQGGESSEEILKIKSR